MHVNLCNLRLKFLVEPKLTHDGPEMNHSWPSPCCVVVPLQVQCIMEMKPDRKGQYFKGHE